jgi:hypothetical protein
MSARGKVLPMHANWLSGTSAALAGGVSSAAAAATWP